MIHRILKNENYVGKIVYNRTSRRLGQKLVNNPLDRWVRSEVVVDPVVDQGHYERAQRIMENRYLSISEDEMLLRLRLLLKRKGKLSFNIINSAAGVPSTSSYVKHFGSLRKAFTLIGYKSPRDCDWIDSREHWSEVLAAQATQVAAALTSAKRVKAQGTEREAAVTVNGKFPICFQVARRLKQRGPNHAAAWRVYRRKGRSGFLVVLRLDDANRAITDYLVLPAAKLRRRPYLYFSAQGSYHGAVRAKTIEEVVTVLKGQAKSFE